MPAAPVSSRTSRRSSRSAGACGSASAAARHRRTDGNETAAVASYGMVSLLGSVPLGAAGWVATNFVARPVLRVYELREHAWEELLFTSNVDLLHDRYDESVVRLRRLAAQVSAIDAAWPPYLRW